VIGVSQRTIVHVVPHTHWDREWYEPFQSFRIRLVDVVDDLIDLMERDATFSRFLLDGQMAVVDDYLEIRPENADRLLKLTTDRRLSCGPWYILMDEFLVSAETIVRNLQIGLHRAQDFGGAMEVGYLPDMFGHVAQMPQILRQAGLDQAVVWRGVPAAVDRSAFWWSAPDGSQVRAQYLFTGYGEGSQIADDPAQLARRIASFAERHDGFITGPVLYMNGNDHEAPQPALGSVVAGANELQDRYQITISSLEEALASMPAAEDGSLPSWRGELRSGARANLLMGVASNHVDVRRAAARAECSLERLAEPLAALFMAADDYPSALLDLAWREVIRNSAHDSICACSHDEVVAEVLVRFAKARQIAEGVRDGALARLALSFAEAGHMIVNPTARARGGVVELLLPGSEPGEGEQPVFAQAGLDTELVMRAEQVRALVSQIDNDQIGRDAFVTGVAITDVQPVEGEDHPVVLDLAVSVGPNRRIDLGLDGIRRDLEARLARAEGGCVRVHLAHMASRRVLARVEGVPGYGWKPYETTPAEHLVALSASEDGTISLHNGLAEVLIDPSDGSLSLNGHTSLNRLVDSGDQGDTYNYSPPSHDEVVDTPVSTELVTKERGPVRAMVEVHRTYRWPERVDDASLSRVGEAEVKVVSDVELRAGECFVRVTTRFFNACRDHRLRAIFPLSAPTAVSRAECSFATVERGLDAEGGPSELALATFPARRFVQAGGLTVCQDGMIEYELIDISGEGEERKAGALALTLLRSTGFLSRLTMTNRPLPAGPNSPLESSQLIGEIEACYCIAVGEVDPFELADDFLVPLAVAPTLGGGERPVTGSALSVEGAEVSALRRTGERSLELRVFNPSPDPSEVSVRLSGSPARGHLVDLRGGELGAFDGSVQLGPWRFATLRLSGEEVRPPGP
jgi:alpha-mannosidase